MCARGTADTCTGVTSSPLLQSWFTVLDSSTESNRHQVACYHDRRPRVQYSLLAMSRNANVYWTLLPDGCDLHIHLVALVTCVDELTSTYSSGLDRAKPMASAYYFFYYLLQACLERCAELESEAVVLSDELTRTSAVAARAAAREVVNGSKDEGVVPVTLHLEEVRLQLWDNSSVLVLMHA